MSDVLIDIINAGVNISSGNPASAAIGYAMIFTCFLYPVFITIFTNEPKLKTFWFNLFRSYQLTPKSCHKLSHLMLAIFAPITYPAFEVLNLIKYTRRRLQLNEFLENDKDLGRCNVKLYIKFRPILLVKPVKLGRYKLPYKRHRTSIVKTAETPSKPRY